MSEPILNLSSWHDHTLNKAYEWERANVGRVYEWERTNIDRHLQAAIMSRDECSDFVRMVALHLGVRVPELTFVQGGHCFATTSGTITLADWGRTHQTILHEMAHIATLDYVLTGEAPHGERFIFQVIDLYVTFMGLDGEKLMKTAREWKLIERTRPIAPAKLEEPAFFAGEF
ncbi:hypothetical protein [Bosea sp. RAC05]|uniref:hypothetical protein n=1 Tax=Bosea sp. RAC05 TaxID=1842539 RepID=UPI00083E2096|nr:hypothetical protein [Bosea sp. RAC05]AOG03446.1 hypothetical protein BSY19_5097 [Bosea sp. RAC05]